MQRIAVKNWSEFQHYKNRSPSWIKLHKRLLDDYDFHRLPVASRALAPMIWLLASETDDGTIDLDLDRIAFRLHMSADDVEAALNPLIEGGFLECYHDASKPLARCKRDAMPEKEREGEKEAEQLDGYAVWELWQDRRKHHGHGTDAAPPSPKVLRMGSEWLEAGADLALIRQAFDSVLGRKGDPPRSLAYCDGAVRDAVKAKPKPAPTFEAIRATRVRTYEATGFWDSSWGPQPEAA